MLLIGCRMSRSESSNTALLSFLRFSSVPIQDVLSYKYKLLDIACWWPWSSAYIPSLSEARTRSRRDDCAVSCPSCRTWGQSRSDPSGSCLWSCSARARWRSDDRARTWPPWTWPLWSPPEWPQAPVRSHCARFLSFFMVVVVVDEFHREKWIKQWATRTKTSAWMKLPTCWRLFWASRRRMSSILSCKTSWYARLSVKSCNSVVMSLSASSACCDIVDVDAVAVVVVGHVAGACLSDMVISMRAKNERPVRGRTRSCY